MFLTPFNAVGRESRGSGRNLAPGLGTRSVQIGSKRRKSSMGLKKTVLVAVEEQEEEEEEEGREIYSP